MTLELYVATVNGYLAYKQHLLPPRHLGGAPHPDDVVQVTRDIVALHATGAAGPYLSLWARVPGFRREMLEDALYETRTLVKVLCMRVTLHAVPSDEMAYFFQALFPYVERRTPPRFRGSGLLFQAGLCEEKAADALLEDLHDRVLAVLAERGPSTTQEIADQVPELQVKIQHDVGKPYEGEFSIGTRLLSGMCAQGLLVRTRVRGTWRSALYEYAPLARWLPDADLESVAPEQARVWLVRRYLAAFGPALADDIQWWTGFTKTDTKKALAALKSEVIQVAIEGLGTEYLMLGEDVGRLRSFVTLETPYAFFLPELDPYIMGYRDRRRFLAEEHRAKLFDRAGNAVPTVWLNGRVAGAWGQREDGSLVYRLFEPASQEEQQVLANEAQRLEEFLAGEVLPPRYRTAFTRALT